MYGKEMNEWLLKQYHFHEIIKLFHPPKWSDDFFKQHIVYKIHDTSYRFRVHGAFFRDWMTENLMQILPQAGDAARKPAHLCAFLQHVRRMPLAVVSFWWRSLLVLMWTWQISHQKSLSLVAGGSIERRAAGFINQNTMGGAWKSKWAP